MNQIEFFKNFMKNLFPFIKRKNTDAFSTTGSQTKRRSKIQINKILNWINRELLQMVEKKNSLRIWRIEIEVITPNEPEGELIVEICKQNNEKRFDFEIYKQKELSNLSNQAYQNFINAGANFPSLRFTKRCSFILNGEFKFFSNELGKLLY